MPLTMVLPEWGGKGVRGSRRSQGWDFTSERHSVHVVSFCLPPMISRVVLWTGMPLTMLLLEVGGKGVRGSRRSQGWDFTQRVTVTVGKQRTLQRVGQQSTLRSSRCSSAGPSRCSV